MNKKTLLIVILVVAIGIISWLWVTRSPTTEVWVVNAGRVTSNYGYESVTNEAFLTRIANGKITNQIPVRVGSFSLDIYKGRAYVASWDASTLSTVELAELEKTDPEAAAETYVNVIQVVDLNKKEVMREFSSEGEAPSDVLVYDDKIFVTNYLSDSVTVFALDTEEYIASIEVGKAPRSIRVSPNNLLFVPNTQDNSVSVVDPESLTEIKRIKVGSNPQVTAFTEEVALVPADAFYQEGQDYDERTEPLTTISLDDLEVIPPTKGDPEFVASDILVTSTGEIFLTHKSPHVIKILDDGWNLDSTDLLSPEMEDGRTLRLVEANSLIYVTLYDAGQVVELDFDLNIKNRYEVGSGAYDIVARAK